MVEGTHALSRLDSSSTFLLTAALFLGAMAFLLGSTFLCSGVRDWIWEQNSCEGDGLERKEENDVSRRSVFSN